MAKAQQIKKLVQQAVQTLEHPTQPEPAVIKQIELILINQGDPWRLVGNEKPNEVKLLESALTETATWLAAMYSGLEPYWLVLIGPSGTGKTLLMEKVRGYLESRAGGIYHRTVAQKLDLGDERRIWSYVQEGAMFKPWRDLVPHTSEFRWALERAGKDWIKLIDDLKPQTGQETVIDGETGVQPKRYEVTAAGDLLDQRLRKWTMISSNLTRKQLSIFWDARIASRLMRHGSVMIDLSEVEDFGLRLEQHRESRR